MASDKQVRIELPIVPSLDKKASRAAVAEVKALEKELSSIKLSFNEIIKASRDVTQELRKIPSEAAKANRSTAQGVRGGGSAKARMRGSAGGGGGGPSPDNKRASDAMEKSANFAIGSQKRIENLQKARFQAMLGIVKNSAGLLSKSGYKSAARSVGSNAGTALANTKSIAKESGGAMGSVVGALAKAGPALTMAATAVSALVTVFSLASENQTKLNKALLDGQGNANDFGASVDDYRFAVKNLNDGILNSSRSFLTFGGNSEKAAKSIAAFSKQSSGSILKTRNEMAMLGGKDGVAGGIGVFYKAAHSYGAALDMSAEQTGELMGKMSQDLGRNARGSVDAMDNIVKAAATSNMPMAKFMDIFHQVIPGVELYQNRLEELTGTIKLLSKNMSAKDVKNFVDSFSNGFKGTSFQQRLKTVLVVGEQTVSKTLGKDFKQKVDSLASSIGDQSGDMWKAAQKGEQAMAAYIADRERSGNAMTGTQKGEAMKLAMNERSRKSGTLGVATAMSGAGMGATFKIMQDMSKKFTGSESQFRELVAKTLGVSDQQYDAMRSMENSTKIFQAELKSSGGQLESKSLQEGLEKIMTDRLTAKGQFTPENLKKALMGASQEDLMDAAELSNYITKSAPKALDVAEAQYNMTSSLGDKLDNVIGFLLEQILSVLNPMLDTLNNTLMWLMGEKDSVKEGKRLGDLSEAINTANKDRFAAKGSEGAANMVTMAADAIAKGQSLIGSGTIEKKDLDNLSRDQVMEMMSKITSDKSQIEAFANRYDIHKQENGEKGGQGAELLSYLGSMGGGVNANDAQMRVAEYMAQSGKISEKAKKFEQHPDRRPGAAGPSTLDDAKRKAEEANSDHNENFSKTQEKQLKVSEAQKKLSEDQARSGMDLSSKQNDKSKTATTEAMTTALAQQAAKSAYIDADPALAAHKAELLGQSGLMLPDQMKTWLDDQNNPIKPGHANGGSIDYDQVARIHKGEFVVPKGGMLVSGGGSGGKGPKVGTLILNLNVKTDADPKQIANEIHSAFERQ